MNAGERRAYRWGSLFVLLVGLLLLDDHLQASGNGVSPLPLACPSGQVTWLSGTTTPGWALLVRFDQTIVGGGSSGPDGRWRIPLNVRAPTGIYPVEVNKRESGELVAAFSCYVDLPVGATPTGSPTRRPTERPTSPTPSRTAIASPSATASALTTLVATMIATPTNIAPSAPTSTIATVTTASLPPTPQPTRATPTSTDTSTGQSLVVVIAAQADDPNDSELFEYVILENQSPAPQGLAGWRLVHVATGEAYTLPLVTLHAGEQLVIWSGEGEDDPTAGTLFWPATSGRWSEGDTAELHNPDGLVVSSLLVSASEGGEE